MKIGFISLLHDELRIPSEPCSPASLINWNLWHFQFQPGAISGTETVSLGICADPWYGTIFLFLEQIAPSWRHLSTHVSWFLASMLWRCGIKYWELLDSLADFSQRWQGIRNQGSSMYYVLMLLVNERVSFQGRKFLDFALWMNNICSR